MAVSKYKLVAGMKRSHLYFEEKIEVLNYASKNSKKGCRDIAAHFKIVKTATASILKDAKTCNMNMSFLRVTVKQNKLGSTTLVMIW